MGRKKEGCLVPGRQQVKRKTFEVCIPLIRPQEVGSVKHSLRNPVGWGQHEAPNIQRWGAVGLEGSYGAFPMSPVPRISIPGNIALSFGGGGGDRILQESQLMMDMGTQGDKYLGWAPCTCSHLHCSLSEGFVGPCPQYSLDPPVQWRWSSGSLTLGEK